MIKEVERLIEEVSRNPFLSRAGFDRLIKEVERLIEEVSRNPFLSRAGFDIACKDCCDRYEYGVAIPF